MRKIIGLLLVSTLALTACGEKEKPKKEENKKSHTQKHKDSEPKKQKKKRKKLKIKIHLVIAYKIIQTIKTNHKTINLIIIQIHLIILLQI